MKYKIRYFRQKSNSGAEREKEVVAEVAQAKVP